MLDYDCHERSIHDVFNPPPSPPPPGQQMLSETLDHCRESAELDPATAYKALKEYVLSSSPSKTLYLLEVRACVAVS